MWWCLKLFFMTSTAQEQWEAGGEVRGRGEEYK